jgi:S-(hydroxymethyl)glutathione dehydrogenase / alcohol dehydrogenase
MDAASSAVRAQVMRAVGAPLRAETLEQHPLDGDLVQVRILASGVCHSDLHVVDGGWEAPLPIVLGHEGAGVVEAVGPLAHAVRPGDLVVLVWQAPCRRCVHCAAGRAWLCTGSRSPESLLPDGSAALAGPGGEPVYAYLGLGTFADRTLVPESAAIPVDPRTPPPVAALIGCAVSTGVGAVLNTARVRPGESALVLGCGGVGQSVILGLHLAGAHPIIAVDLAGGRLEQARELGATHVLHGDDPDLEQHVAGLTGGGAQHGFEAIGRAETIERLPALVGRGGQGVLVGMTATGVRATIDPFALADQSKRIVGCNYGWSVPAVDFPKLAALHRAGHLPLERLIGRRTTLDEAGRALEDLRSATGLRTILEPEPD